MTRTFLAISLAVLASAASAATVHFDTPAHALVNARFGQDALLAHDVDGDGRQELVIAFSQPFPMLAVIEMPPSGDWRTRQVLPLGGEGNSVELLLWSAPGADEIITLRPLAYGVSEAVRFGGSPLRELARFDIAAFHHGAAVADADGDGSDELLAPAPDALRAFHLPGGAAAWSLPGAVSEVLAVPLDGDAAMELVLAGTPGRIVDGASRALELSHVDGFWPPLLAAHPAANATEAWFLARQGVFSGVYTAWKGAPYAPVFEAPDLSASAIARDLDGDAREEVIANTLTGLRVYDPQQRATRIVHPLPPRVAAFEAIDLGGDAARDFALMLTSGRAELGAFIQWIDGASSEMHPAIAWGGGEIGAVARGDVDADGQEEIVIGKSGRPGGLFVFDAATGALEHSAESLDNASHYDAVGIRDIALAQLDADPALEIATAGYHHHGALVVRDGASFVPQLALGPLAFGNEGPLDYEAQAVEPHDLEGDGALELIVAGANRIEAYALDGTPRWSQPLTNSGSFVYGLFTTQADADAAPEFLLATDAGVFCIDGATRATQWEWRGDMPLTAAAFAVDLAGGPQLIVAEAVAITHLAVDDRRVLARYSLGRAPHGIAPLPGSARWWLAGFDDHLAIVDRRGRERGRTPRMMQAANRRPLEAHAHGDGWRLTIGSASGYSVLTAVAPDYVFDDGFD